MKEVVLPEGIIQRLEDIYNKLQLEYHRVAKELRFSCTGCSDNCCDSYFLHHTYVEWAHLWIGLRCLEPGKLKEIVSRAHECVNQSREVLAKGERPQIMCPLNEDGLCILYHNRLLVCRTHGVPASLTRPDGKRLQFPGCFRCQEIVDGGGVEKQELFVERTPLLRKLVLLEKELFDNKRHLYPKVSLTISEMIVKGPPKLAEKFCER